MSQNMFNPHIAQSTTHDFFSDAKFEIRIREVILPENVEYKFGTPLTSEDGVNFEASGTRIMALLANTVNTNGLTDPKDREVAAYWTGGFNQRVVEWALGEELDVEEIIEARSERQIDIYPWQEAPVPITFSGGI